MKRLGVMAVLVGAVATTSAQDIPKPAPELDQVKWMEGNWTCDGTMQMPSPHPIKATYKAKRDLDRFWLMGVYAEKKTPENSLPMTFHEWTTYDSAGKKWTRLTMTATGGWTHWTGTGTAEHQEWTGEGYEMGQKVGLRETIEKKSGKEASVSGQMSMDGKQWLPAWTLTCKK